MTEHLAECSTYETSPERCTHTGEHHPLTTTQDPWLYSAAHHAMLCAHCGTLAIKTMGGLYHPEAPNP
jgi:hypothetical protein